MTVTRLKHLLALEPSQILAKYNHSVRELIEKVHSFERWLETVALVDPASVQLLDQNQRPIITINDAINSTGFHWEGDRMAGPGLLFV